MGEPATLVFLKREGGVTSSRVRRRRFNDTGTPPVSRWRACSEARREEILLHAGAPRQLFNTLGLSTIERRTFHSFEMAAFYKNKNLTILGGGSLGSCVDEERSQLRELM